MTRAELTLIDPELLARRRRFRLRLTIGGGLLVALILVLVLGRPASHAIKGWQARRHAEKAFRLIEAEEWNEAAAEARAAYQLWPNEPAALRAVARLLSRTRQSEALGFWNSLREKTPLTRQDLRDEAAIALQAGEFSGTERAITELLGPKEGGPGPADNLLAAQLAIQKTQLDDARQFLIKVLNHPQANTRQQLQASLLELTIVSPEMANGKEAISNAWARLSKIARGQDSAALDALTILAQHSLFAPNEIVSEPAVMPDEEIMQALEKHLLSRAPQALLALDLRAHLAPEQREPLIRQGIERWQKSDNPSLLALATWLNSKGEYQRELDTIPLERALQTRDLFLQRLDALGALERWEDIRRLLENERFPLDDTVEHMYLARCYAQLGQEVASQNNWRRALESAAGDPQKLLPLADYAEKNGALTIAQTAYDTIAREKPGVRAAQQGRLHLAQKSRDTRQIHALLVEMSKQWPNDAAIQNDEAYTRLLLAGTSQEPTTASSAATLPKHRELTDVAQKAKQLVQREPSSLPHRTLLALARLRLSQPAQAIEVYHGIRVLPNTASASAMAVHAAVLAANGQEKDAKTEAESINRDQLLPEEVALIEKLNGNDADIARGKFPPPVP